MKLGYPVCFNSGTLLWFRHNNNNQSIKILTDWWHSSGEPYELNSKFSFTTKWRDKWPWEQAQMYKMYLKYKSSIMILSFPKLPYLPWTSFKNPKSQYPTDFIEPWCFSHWPGANCFITHFCASINQKMKIISDYQINYNNTVYFKQKNNEIDVIYIKNMDIV